MITMPTIFGSFTPGAVLLAQAPGPNFAYSWGVILLSIALGLLITLKSSNRKSEIKRR